MTEPKAPSMFEGGCACGAVRYRCDSPPLRMVNCHCRSCQRYSGSAYSPTVIVPRRSVVLTRGQTKVHELVADSSHVARREFCAECGSPLFASSSGHEELLGIKAGSLDDPSWYSGDADVWVASAQPWDSMNPATQKFDKGPRKT